MLFEHKTEHTVLEVRLRPRSALILSGPARWEWAHSIPRRVKDKWSQNETVMRDRRISLTFRTMA